MTRYMLAADYAMRQALSVKFVQPETTTKRYYARDERSLTGFQPNVNQNSGPPDRHKFPVLGTQAQPDVRAYRAPLTVGDTDPPTRELEAVGWTSSNYVTGFASGWGNFRQPSRVDIGYALADTRCGRGRAVTGHASPMAGTHWNAAAATMVLSELRRHLSWAVRRTDHDLCKGRHPESAARRIRSTPDPTVRQSTKSGCLRRIHRDHASRFYRSRPTGFQGGSL